MRIWNRIKKIGKDRFQSNNDEHLFSESKFRKIIFLYTYLNDWHLNETKRNLAEFKKDKVIVAWNVLPLGVSRTLKRITREKVMKKVSLVLRTFLYTVSNTKFKGSSRLSPRKIFFNHLPNFLPFKDNWLLCIIFSPASIAFRFNFLHSWRWITRQNWYFLSIW